MDDHSPYSPPSPFAHRIDEQRERDRDRYLGKFSGVWMDIELALIALDVLATYDTAARSAHNLISDALADAKTTIESNV